MSIVLDDHALLRIDQRNIPTIVIEQIASVGVCVINTPARKLLRGEWMEQPIHVLVLKPSGAVHTVYVADEWDSEIVVRHTRKRVK